MADKLGYGSNLSDWQIHITDDCKEALLRKEGMPEELVLKEIFITDVALALYLQWNAGRNNSISQDDLSEKIKQALGSLLRKISGYAEQSGLVLPVFGVLQIPESQQSFKEFIERLAADQDWHRGDFSLFPADDDKKSLELIRRLLSNLLTVWADVKPLEPLTTKQYLSKLQEVRRVEKISQERESLLDAITAAWSEDKPIEPAVMQWLEHRFIDVDGLLVRE